MTSIVERVALAMYCRMYGEEMRPTDCPTLWVESVANAQVALKALRDPGKGVLKLFEELLDTQGHAQTLEESWALLIDTALGKITA